MSNVGKTHKMTALSVVQNSLILAKVIPCQSYEDNQLLLDDRYSLKTYEKADNMISKVHKNAAVGGLEDKIEFKIS